MFKYLGSIFLLICIADCCVYSQNYADSGYYYQKLGSKEKAASFFESYLYDSPDNYQVRLDLGYLYYDMLQFGKAKEQFEYVSTHSPNENELKLSQDAISVIDKKTADNLKGSLDTSYKMNNADSGYYYLKLGKKKKAAELFELHLRENPKDLKTRLQLGYLYYDRKELKKSLRHFDFVGRYSKDPKEVDISKSASFIIREELTFVSPRSIDIYFYNFYDTYQENYIANLVSHVNFLIARNTFTGLYLDLYTDTKSSSTVIYNDRFIEFGGFLKYHFLRNLFVEFRLGYAHRLDVDSNANTINIKPLLVYFNRFGDAKVYVTSESSSKTSFYFDMYYAAMYDYKYKNSFLQVVFQEVLRLMTGGYSYFEGYLSQNVQFDSRRLDYNNYAEVGGGIRFHPDVAYIPVFFVEPTYKMYFFGNVKNSFQVKAGFSFIFRTLL